MYASGEFGNTQIAGTYASNKFTATTADDIAVDTNYEVGYIVERTENVKKVSFNNKKVPKDYYITMQTVDKDEDGILTPFLIVAYKAAVQRNFELSFSSEGDPTSVTLTFDLMEDKNGNILDMIEITDDEITTSVPSTRFAIGGTSNEIKINNAVGTVTATIKDSSDAAYAKITATISGDNDTLILTAANDATAGNYKVILTDGASKTTTVGVTLYSAA